MSAFYMNVIRRNDIDFLKERKADFCVRQWRRKWQPTPVFLPTELCGQRSLVGCCSRGCTELDMTEETQHACMHALDRIHRSLSLQVFCVQVSAAHSCHVALGSSPPSLVLVRLLGWDKCTFFRAMIVICPSDFLSPALPQSPIHVLLPMMPGLSFLHLCS